ncbi:MAG: PAS domain-containing protein [Desulfamplus sp.]|nr:PAS domain-containing protein [Desulfamplus sp.]
MNMLSLSEYAALIEQSPILIWRAKKDTLCDYFNQRWCEFRGRTLEQEYGNGWAEGVHPDDFERSLKIFLDNFNKREIFEMEYRLMRFDGVYRWIFDRGVPYYEDNGDFAGYIGSCIDVTERVEAQEALRSKAEEELHALRGIIPICMHCKEIRDDKGYWNKLEKFITEHSEAQFSHGICPDCMKKFYSEFYEP